MIDPAGCHYLILAQAVAATAFAREVFDRFRKIISAAPVVLTNRLSCSSSWFRAW